MTRREAAPPFALFEFFFALEIDAA